MTPSRTTGLTPVLDLGIIQTGRRSWIEVDQFERSDNASLHPPFWGHLWLVVF